MQNTKLEFTLNEHVLLIESVYTRIERMEKLIQTFVLEDLKDKYEKDLNELKELYDRLNKAYFNYL